MSEREYEINGLLNRLFPPDVLQGISKEMERAVPEASKALAKHEPWISKNFEQLYRKNPAAVALGKIKSPKKARSSRKNGRKGGRPKKRVDKAAQ